MKSTKKTVEEQVKELTTPQDQNIELILSENEIEVYQDIAGYRVGDDFVAIMTKDTQTIVYPISQIKRVRHYNTPKVQ